MGGYRVLETYTLLRIEGKGFMSLLGGKYIFNRKLLQIWATFLFDVYRVLPSSLACG